LKAPGDLITTSQTLGLRGDAMRTWPVQDAKARFSELLNACEREGAQMVTRRGAEAAVLVPIGEWRQLAASARPSLKNLLLSDEARFDLEIPARGAGHHRAAPDLARSSPPRTT